MLGFPGRKVEATIGNVRLANTVQMNLGSDSFVPLRVQGIVNFAFIIHRLCVFVLLALRFTLSCVSVLTGIKNNILIDKDGEFYADGRLKQLLQAGGDGSPNSKKLIPRKDDVTKKGSWANHLESKKKKRHPNEPNQINRIG